MANVTITGINEIIKTLSSFVNIKNEIENQNSFLEETLKDFQSIEIPDIAKTEGENIKAPFREKKGETGDFREYDVPKDFYLGVYTAEAYFALMNGVDTKNIKIIKEVGNEKIIYGYEDTEDIDFNINVSKKFLEFEGKKIQSDIEKMLNKYFN